MFIKFSNEVAIVMLKVAVVVPVCMLLLSCTSSVPSEINQSSVKSREVNSIIIDKSQSLQSDIPKKVLPKLSIKQSIDIFNYASSLREDCMLLFNYVGVALLYSHGDDVSGLNQSVQENNNGIVDKLKDIKSKAVEITTRDFKRPEQGFNSSEKFLLDMEQKVLNCNHSVISMIDSIVDDGNFIVNRDELSESEIITRYKSNLSPQLHALLMTYAFEAIEYEGYDAWFSAQNQFVLLMTHIYQTLIVAAEGYLNIREMPDKNYFHNAQATYSILKENTKKEVDMLSGMRLALRLADSKSLLSSVDKKETGLQSDMDNLLNELDQGVGILLIELSKDSWDDEAINTALIESFKVVIGHEVSRTEYRKKYIRELINVMELALKQKGKK